MSQETSGQHRKRPEARNLQQDVSRKCPRYICNIQILAIDFDNLKNKLALKADIENGNFGLL